MACSGSNEETVALPDIEAGQGGRCDTTYYSELRGNYQGSIEYSGPDAACAWNVEMQVSTQPQTTGPCFTFVSLSSDILSSDFGDSTRCSDMGIGAQLDEPYIAEQSLQLLNSPVWPVDTSMTLSMTLAADKLFPVGQTGSVQLVTLRFDGTGNVMFPVMRLANENFAGVLIKQIDR